MRVLAIGSVYPPHLLGGYELTWQGVSRQLRADGHLTRVLVSDFRHSEVEVPAGAPEDPDVHRELDWYWRDHAWRRLSWRDRITLERHNAAVLERHLTTFAPDVVAFWPMGGMSLSLIGQARRSGRPLVGFLHDPWPVYGPHRDGWLAPFAGPLGRMLARPAARMSGLNTQVDLAVGRWVVCSDWMAAHSGLPGRPTIEVLRPGIEERFLAVSGTARDRFDGNLLVLGRVVEQKGVMTAIEALARLPDSMGLTIAGSGDRDYRDGLARRARELGVDARVRFHPQVDRDATVGLLASADVVLHPVLWDEPWGLAPLEAMAVGRAVVATGRGGSAEYLRDGENALLHPPGDAAGLAGAVMRLAEDPDLRARLVRAGRATAEAHRAVDFDRRAVEVLRAAAAGSGD